MRFVAVAAAIAIALGAGILALRSPTETQSAFHRMRIYAVGGGAGGNAGIQYVELRMASAGQSQVGGHDICFFDENGDPWARFSFDDNVSNGASGSSILTGSTMMDTKWPAGEPDFTFGAGNTTAIAAGADPDTPVHPGSGKVAFGSDPTNPAEMCAGSFDVIDSIAYGSGYSGTVDFGTKFASDLPVSGTQAIELQAGLCLPGCQENSTDYAVADAEPRNNGGDLGPLDLNATPTPSPTPAPSPTATPTPTPLGTETPTPTVSASPSASATPGPTASPSASPTATAVPGAELVFGDGDCGGASNAVDALKTLQFVAAIPFQQEPQCPEFGAELSIAVPASHAHIVWGDVNCDGAVNAVDALQVLRHLAALGVTQAQGCPPIGGPVQIVP